MTVRNNFRIEFVGGPNDGTVTYQWAQPDEEFEFVFETGESVELHQYRLHWSNTFQAKYLYTGMS